MQTLEFLYYWKYGGLDGERCYAWAERLLLDGHESDALLQLLGVPDADWETRDKWIKTILREIDVDPSTINNVTLLRAFERMLVEEYLAGRISVETLVDEAYHKITIESDYADEFILWCELDEDLYSISCGGAGFYHLDRNDVAGSLRCLLEREGKTSSP